MKAMKQDVWYQVSGDVNVPTYGGTLARWDGYGVEFYRITPVLDAAGTKAGQDVGFPFWTEEAYMDVDAYTVFLDGVRDMMYDDDGCDALNYEPGPSGWSKDILERLGGTVQGHEWFAKQGHGFRSADAEFRQEIEN